MNVIFMRKKSLALSLMLAFSCLLGGNLMGQTYQISNATSGSNTNYPAVSEKGYSVTQQIFSQSEIFSSTNVSDGSTFNYSSGGTITALYFYNMKKVDIELNCDIYYTTASKSGYTSGTDWISLDNFTKIYDASTSGNVTFAKESWNSISLTTTISYNGKNNLVIMFVNKDMDSETQLSFWGWTPSYSNYPSINYSSTSPINLNTLSTITGTRNYQHNAIRFDITPAEVGCVSPQNLEYSDVTDSEATFTWDAVDGEIDGYEVYVSEDSTSPTEETSGSFTATNSYTKNSLEENTHYYAWVRTKCEEDSYSSWSSAIDFTTDCGIKNLTYTYGFEDASDLDCWTMNNCYSSTKITSGTTHTGTYKFIFNYSTSHDLQTIITPELNTTANGLRVDFFFRTSSSSGTPKLKIAYSTTTNELASFDWTNCIEATVNSYYYNNYQYFGIDLPYSGIKYIAIQYDRNGSSNNIYLDDIKFSDIPTVNLPYEYGFETDTELNSWIKRDCHSSTGIKTGGHTGSNSFGFIRGNTMETQYLITPMLNGTTNGALISLYFTADANCKFQIGYSTTNDVTSSFTFGDEVTETTASYKYYDYYCPANTKFICIKYVATSTTNYALNIDDIKIVTFDKVSDGEYWYNTLDWSPVGVPSATDNVYIKQDMTIPNECVASAKDITIGTGGSLTIADGGQLILPTTSTGVQATVKKETYAATAKDAISYYWYAISSAVANPSISNATNLITETVAPYHYDLYRYNEEKNADLPWENYKNTAYSSTFTTLEKGRGYLYRNASDLSIAMTGEINVADFNYSVTNSGGPLAGFNLIGNPYSHDIYKGAGTAIPNGSGLLRTGFYYMEPTTGKWTAGTDNSTAIKPNQGVLVQTDANGSIEMKNTNSNGSSKSNNDNIMFKVANSQYSDEAYAWFDKGRGLNKISHRNAEVPMLYINQDGENYAIATMSDDIKTFSLNFKAMTMGKYTLSYKTKGEFNYLHVIDRFTGEDVDMLLEGEYSFVASPNDSDARFIVRLEYTSNNGTNDSSVFAYQSGNEIIVSGEGELQIFDVMGRKISTHQINGVETVNVNAHGVYIFKLNEKTQKIIIK